MSAAFKLRIYVAAPWEYRARAQEVAENLETIGAEITHKWWDGADSNWTKGDNLIGDKFHTIAQSDLQGVQYADFVVALQSATGGCGVFVEIGAALGRYKAVYLIPAVPGFPLPPQRSVFDNLCERRSEEGLYDMVRSWISD